ncbi:MAG: agmatinase [Arenicella sp.]
MMTVSTTNSENLSQFVAPDYPIFLGSEIRQPHSDRARFHVLPVPYEASVSYGGGTSLGPQKILQASWQLETWDGASTPSEQGIFTHPPVSVGTGPEAVINAIASTTQAILEQEALPVVLGGEHTVTYGVIKGFLDAGVTDFGVVQIDAHADLRDTYEGDPYSHACVMKRILTEDIPVFQLGVRALCHEEVNTRSRYGVQHLDADVLVPGNISSFQLPNDFPDKVFFTLDVDGMDPSVFPSTGTPVPGGLLWYQTLSLFECVARQRKIIGFDIMEFAPIEGFHAYEFSAALLVHKMMGIVQRSFL